MRKAEKPFSLQPAASLLVPDEKKQRRVTADEERRSHAESGPRGRHAGEAAGEEHQDGGEGGPGLVLPADPVPEEGDPPPLLQPDPQGPRRELHREQDETASQAYYAQGTPGGRAKVGRRSSFG